jgi:ubiquitin-conjugating enzyme E2 D/E
MGQQESALQQPPVDMRRCVKIPLDEQGELLYVRQARSHELSPPDELEDDGPWRPRLELELEGRVFPTLVSHRFSRTAGATSFAKLRRIGPRHVIAAMAINEEISVYCGGVFFLEYVVPCDYPISGPRVRMLTRCQLRGETGECWDPGSQYLGKCKWSPGATLSDMLLAHLSLFVHRTVDKRRVPGLTQQFSDRRAAFNEWARTWTKWFAHGPIPFGRWSPATHSHFPAWMRRRVVVWLLVWKRNRSELCDMPHEVALLVCSYLCTADAYAYEYEMQQLAVGSADV